MSYDVLAMFDRMYQGKMTGFVCQGFNPLASVANKKKVGDALAKLKYPGHHGSAGHETSEFWKNYGEVNPADPAAIQTEVFRLPVAFFAEEAGTCTNSGRVVRWHWKAVEGPGESKSDVDIMAHLYLTLKAMYAKDGGAFPDPVLKLSWPLGYRMPAEPSPEELLMEISARR